MKKCVKCQTAINPNEYLCNKCLIEELSQRLNIQYSSPHNTGIVNNIFNVNSQFDDPFNPPPNCSNVFEDYSDGLGESISNPVIANAFTQTSNIDNKDSLPKSVEPQKNIPSSVNENIDDPFNFPSNSSSDAASSIFNDMSVDLQDPTI